MSPCSRGSAAAASCPGPAVGMADKLEAALMASLGLGGGLGHDVVEVSLRLSKKDVTQTIIRCVEHTASLRASQAS